MRKARTEPTNKVTFACPREWRVSEVDGNAWKPHQHPPNSRQANYLVAMVAEMTSHGGWGGMGRKKDVFQGTRSMG